MDCCLSQTVRVPCSAPSGETSNGANENDAPHEGLDTGEKLRGFLSPVSCPLGISARHRRCFWLYRKGVIMEINVGKWDRMLRIVMGGGLLALMFLGPKTVLELFGIIPLASGIACHCPIYGLFGISTYPRAKPVREKRAAII
jgi:hypothetical protein